MSDELARRVARRRRQFERQRAVRRRRRVLATVVLAVVAVPVFLIVSGGSENAPVAPVEASVGGAQPDASWKPSKAPVPILMYHVIGDVADGASLPALYLSADDFQEQVNWLDRHGYTAVTLIQVQDAWFEGATLPEKPVVLSFDDGYLGQYTEAMPILEERGWAGQLNLKAEGSDLSTTMVRKMMDAGWEVAAHTINHLDLTTLSGAQLEDEISGSRRLLQKELDSDIPNFCYPAGKYDNEVVKAVEAAGFRGATTVDPGMAERSEPFELKRIRMNQGDGADVLEADLAAWG
ncbi:MAG: polysaccharide deacetylase family protein [Solirubrobacterales bacterium]